MAALIETFAHAENTEAPWWNKSLVGVTAKTWQEFQKAAGLNWEVKKIPLYWKDSDAINSLLDSYGEYHEQVEGYAIKRSSDDKILGVVGPQYTPVQNETVFEWFNPWVEAGTAKFDTAGSLKGGKVVWALASVSGMEGEVKPNDTVRRHILLSNSHDGSLAIRAGMTDIRVVCNNTLTAAHADQTGRLPSIRHTKSAEDTMKRVQDTMSTLLEQFNEDLKQYKRLAETPAPFPAVEQYTKQVFDLDDPEVKLSKRAEQMVVDIMLNFQQGIGNTGETWWDAYNGVTQMLTHSRGKDPEKRLMSNWFGDSAAKNKKALQLAYTYATV